MNGLSLRHQPAMTNGGLLQGGSGCARRSKQSLNESPGLVGIQLKLIALIDDLASHFTAVRNDEFSHRASFDRSRFPEKLFVRRSYPGDKALAFLFFNYRLHEENVCLCGTQCKG